MSEIVGLARKDWLLMSRKIKLLFLYILVMIVIFSMTMDDSSALAGFFTVLMFMMSINCFAYDEQVNFDKLAASSPILPIKVVLARYIAALSVGIGGSAVIMLVNYLVLVFRKSAEAQSEQMLEAFIGAVAVAAAIVSLFFPVFYKFGVNKSRIVMLLLFGIPALLFFTITSILPKNFFAGFTISEGLLSVLPYLIAVVLIAVFIGSIFLSTRILHHKEY